MSSVHSRNIVMVWETALIVGGVSVAAVVALVVVVAMCTVSNSKIIISKISCCSLYSTERSTTNPSPSNEIISSQD